MKHIYSTPTDVSVHLLGLPFSADSNIGYSHSSAPDRIRQALVGGFKSWWTETGIHLGGEGTLLDVGDVDWVPDRKQGLESIEEGVRTCLERARPLITMGGDRYVAYPLMSAMARRYPKLTVVQFDAHSGMGLEAAGSGHYSHASAMSRIVDSQLVQRLIQVGVRTLTGNQYQRANDAGVTVIGMDHLDRFNELQIEGPVYVSIDLDVMDPAFASDIALPEPGGMSVREVLRCLHAIRVPLVGADVVGLHPKANHGEQTAQVAAKLIRELAGNMLGKQMRSAWEASIPAAR